MKMNGFSPALLVAAFAVGLTTAAYADTYIIDPVHSSVSFSVKHLTVSEVKGQFGEFAGTVDLDPATGAIAKADAEIKTKSINTGNEKRDGHLRTTDFFDAEKYPEITFKSTGVTSGNITGDLTIKGVTKQVTIPVTVSGPIKHPMSGDKIIGLSGQTTINRQDFGVSWNKQLDQGGLMVGDEVQLNINFEAAKKSS